MSLKRPAEALADRSEMRMSRVGYFHRWMSLFLCGVGTGVPCNRFRPPAQPKRNGQSKL